MQHFGVSACLSAEHEIADGLQETFDLDGNDEFQPEENGEPQNKRPKLGAEPAKFRTPPAEVNGKGDIDEVKSKKIRHHLALQSRFKYSNFPFKGKSRQGL